MNAKAQYALVTGATSGIGYELAKLLAKDGYNLVLVARSVDDLNRTAQEIAGLYDIKVMPLPKDLFQRDAPFQIYDLLKAKDINVEILVNDAGQGQYGEFIDTDIDREMDIIQLNITSLVVLTKLFLKEMVDKKKGRILNVASIAGKVPGPLQAVYHGTKAFVHSFTEAIRNEVKKSGVTVTSLLPGATDTDFFRKADMLDAKNVKEGKLDDPADVAQDGFDAMMKGEDMIVPGVKNKLQVAVSNFTPDEMLAEKIHKAQAPTEEHQY